jgi:uncharacterized protein (TIGR02611 family)
VEQQEKHPLIASIADRRERHLQRSRLYRAVFAVAGATVTLAGLVMFVTPGPALVVIPIGLAMLALEFAWAERLLEHAVERAEAAKQTAVEASRAQKIFGALATIAAIAAAVVAAILWDIPLLPV